MSCVNTRKNVTMELSSAIKACSSDSVPNKIKIKNNQ